MKREMYKFLSGSFAALAYAHAAYAVATARGIINEPVFLGKRWGVGYMWTEAAVYSAVSVALGYKGWRVDSKQLVPAEGPLPSEGDAILSPTPMGGDVQMPSGATGSSSASVK